MLFEGLNHIGTGSPAVHLIGTVHQTLAANAGVPACQRRVVAVTQGAVQLNCCVDHLLHHVRQKHLGDAVFLTEIFTALRLVGDVQQH